MRTDLKLITSSLLLLSVFSATARGDGTTDAGVGAASLISGAALGLTSVIGGVQSANNLAGAVGASARMGAVGSQLGQTNAALAQALATEAQCEQKANAAYKANSDTPDSLSKILAQTPTCSTYLAVWTAGNAWNAKFNAANGRFACIKTMQANMDALATGQFSQQLKAYIDAANASYDSQQAIVTNYEDMGKKIKGDLEGEGGFVNQLDQLHAAINQLQSIIGGAATGGGATSDITMGGEAFAGNLSQQVADLKIANNQVGNTWMKNIISDAVNNCFVSNGNIPCRINNTGGQVNMSPLQCIQSATSQSVGQSSTQGILNSGNANNISSLIQQQQDMLQKSIVATTLDPANINGFTSYVKSQFSNALTSMSSQFNGIALNGSGVTVAQLQSFYQSAMNQCFNQAMNNFQQDINSQGPRYYAAYSQLNTQKNKILSTENQATTTITNLMNKFVTNFSQNYSSGLAQFAANCSATTDPNAGLDCLRELKAQLESGINGNTSFAQLSTGGSYTSSPSPTYITLQHLTLDAQGNPVSAPDQQSCVGFNACITLMKQRETYDEGQAITYKQKLVGFAKQANTQISTVVGAAATTFGLASQQISKMVADLTSTLASLGVSSAESITMKKADPASLNKDKDKNNLFSSDPMPDMKGLLGVSDMDPDSVKSNNDAANAARDKIGKKIKDASSMIQYCSVTQSDFKGLEKFLNSCQTPYAFCSSGTQLNIDSAFQKILNRGQEMGSKRSDSEDDAGTPDTLSSQLKDCKSDVSSTCNADPANAACATVSPPAPLGANPTSAEKTAFDNATSVYNASIQCQTDRPNKLARCVSDSNAECNSRAQSVIFSYHERDPLGPITESIEGKLSDLDSACSLNLRTLSKATRCPPLNTAAKKAPESSTPSPDDTSDPIVTACKASCANEDPKCITSCTPALSSVCSACAALWYSMQDAAENTPLKMAVPSDNDPSKSGINGDNFDNPVPNPSKSAN